MIKKISFGIAALGLAAAPALAQVAMGPSGAPLSGDESELSEGGTIILGVLGAAVIIGGIMVASDDNNPQIPVSG
ncbi:hypothetical protein CHX26_09000 [Porphyrobacter sp. HT-58-2]|uniref:hypothetical protein n=1 Tax=Porphyrobacter sp. HT-58-2 TaxID=2023229 RepID=UPI000CDC5028|nr:hypothetical protein [Porphyrobacter sp. HT-58-2]AUX69614.1 hypothetical protein CHX26_09000 [Porphyrobacter sp. HT-58-2]